eukprot:CAMPEP_0118882848 /NCGR_PEP_ID=MMETSP1163-20130328/22016_1 /TAXON_ID=124430 /ORGANISM="Phaeomonas parva, Strain CCMP2877" /LENGTH=144 /DNA_ID=CAMNT_0006820053 /DNA_START=316 /DNA_END=752 /DNA_ORIENTATION=+
MASLDWNARSEVAIMVSARGLKDSDMFSKATRKRGERGGVSRQRWGLGKGHRSVRENKRYPSSGLDPFTTRRYATLSLWDNGAWVELGRTAQLKDTQDPDWAEQFDVTYYFEETQKLRVAVVDSDGSGNDDLQGEAEFVLGHLM